MQRIFLYFFFVLASFSTVQGGQLEDSFRKTYALWQKGMASKDYRIWDSITSSDRKRVVRNKIYSERFPFPKTVFKAPFLPPPLKELKLLQAKGSGHYGKAVFFGKVDFGVGGTPTDNLLVVSYKNEGGHWRFAGAEYVNLSGLKSVRSAILKGDYSYLKGADFQPTAVPQRNTIKLSGPVPLIAKVYAFCPGREVRAQVNNVSNHLFQNTKEAEVVIGGGRTGGNEIQLGIKTLPGGGGNEPLCVRVYVMSQVAGVQPVKVFEYLVAEKGAVKAVQTVRFEIDQADLAKLSGK